MPTTTTTTTNDEISALCATQFNLTANGLVVRNDNDGDDDSKTVSASEMHDLVPLMRRWAVQFNKGFDLRKPDQDKMTLHENYLCTHPKFPSRVFQYKSTGEQGLSLEQRKKWTAQYTSDYMDKIGFPDKQLLLAETSKSNVLAGIADGTYKLSRKVVQFLPAGTEAFGNLKATLNNRDFHQSAQMYNPDYEEAMDELGLLGLLSDEDGMVDVPLLDTPQKGASRLAAATALGSEDGGSPMMISPGDDVSRTIRSPPSVGDDASIRKPLTSRMGMEAYEEDEDEDEDEELDEEDVPRVPWDAPFSSACRKEEEEDSEEEEEEDGEEEMSQVRSSPPRSRWRHVPTHVCLQMGGPCCARAVHAVGRRGEDAFAAGCRGGGRRGRRAPAAPDACRGSRGERQGARDRQGGRRR